jgi:2-polyprenyl-3-methyl-5-hydroxy-6-metoxy-1,4-benzoquinol methylase
MNSLLGAENHFAFGENWKSFVHLLDDRRIEDAENGLRRLLPNGELKGGRFLDIGCGSGLSALAALRLGAATVDAIDIDASSVVATKATLTGYAPNDRWSARIGSVFDLTPDVQAGYDIVHSWGVLHHTGDMWRAVGIAASLVRPGGHFVCALYHKTDWCGFWTREKEFYSNAPPVVQAIMRGAYKSILVARMLRAGTNPFAAIRNYRTRGMDWSHDIHDWLGGYPYESAAAEDVRAFLHDRGFTMVREFLVASGSGIFGTGCDEFVAVRAAD